MMTLNFSRLLEILFPLSEDEKAIASYNTTSFLLKRAHIHFGDVEAIASFKDKAVRSALHLNKFHAHPHAQKLLAALLTSRLLEFPKQPYILIPIPLSKKRMRERGYNQVALVAEKALSSIAHITLKTAILKKDLHTAAQTTLRRDERLRNLKGVFTLTHGKEQEIKGNHIILLDDVVTTGATLSEAKATLLPFSPAAVTCIALAH